MILDFIIEELFIFYLQKNFHTADKDLIFLKENQVFVSYL